MFKRKLIAVIVCIFMAVNLVACGGDGVGNECTHQWSEWTPTTVATCSNDGVKERQCALCQETESDVIPKLAHDWEGATCKAPKTCKNCGETEGIANAHSFTEKIVKSQALKSSATCSSPAVYYYSCSCGEISDTETFTRGNTLPHNYNQEIVKDEALKTKATCTSPALYYFSCECGAIGDDETFEYGNPAHYYTEKVVKQEALKEAETKTTPAVYYTSCVCGLVSETETFVNKNAIIFGDSYSAYHSTLPSGYNAYYNGTNILSSADQMWFSLLFKDIGYNLIRNDSRSGSAISFTGYSGGDWSNSVYSFINRLKNLVDSGYFNENRVDVVYIFGGTNDSWINGELGEETYSGWTKQDLYKALPAICYFYIMVREALPNAEIYGIANCGLKQEIINAIDNASDYVNGKAVLLENIDTTSSHPTALGMEQIKNQILAVMNE